ncbi:MAG: hypothetical protein AAF363_19155 [Bacteroidota bacterium]
MLLVGIYSCDEEDSPSFNFEDQIAQGSIDGDDWTFATGTAKDLGGGQEGVSIELSNVSISDPCDEFIFPSQIRFALFSTSIGVFPISDDTSGFANFIGIGFVEGAIEIESINNTTVSGRVDVRFTDPDTNVISFINGDFMVPFCN